MNPDAALKALAEPHRRAILQLVARDPRPVGDIAGHLDITPQAVSRHLKVLREAGLVDERREGTRRLYSIRAEGLEELHGFLDELLPSGLERLKQAAEEEERTEHGRGGERN